MDCQGKCNRPGDGIPSYSFLPATIAGCLTDGDCPVGINTTVVTTTNNVKVTYCCPSLINKPHVQTVQGATPKDVCSCSSHGDDRGSPEEKVRQWAELTKDYGKNYTESDTFITV